MRPERMRVPGFPEAKAGAPEPPASPALGGGVRQLNVRVPVVLLDRYGRLLRDLADEGYRTSMTELVAALLHDGPQSTAEARRAIRAWRRALDPDLG